MILKNFSNWLNSKLNESSNNIYEYGCAMVYYDLPQMKELHDSILEEDIYTEVGDNTYGLENEPHTTLLYGFHNNVDPNEVLDTCEKHEFLELKLVNPSCFNSENYDVLKFDITYPTRSGAFLHKCNSELTKYPHTTSFPNYHPHCTIAYIKKGKGQHYADLFKDKSYLVTPNKLVYSMANGGKVERNLN
jgi:2'-5' RNA ligase